MFGCWFKFVVFLSSCSPDPEEPDLRLVERVNSTIEGEKSLVVGEDPGHGLVEAALVSWELEEHEVNVQVEQNWRENTGNLSRIVGGVPARKHEFPFMVKVRGCGGSLISSQHILTAAHCVDDMNKRDLRKYKVTLGDHDLSTTSEAQSLRRGVSAIIFHRSFDPRKMDSDVAIVKMNAPVVFSPTIQPIGLVAAGSSHTGRLVTVAGWGTRAAGGGISNVLRKVKVRVVSRRSCQDAYPRLTGTMVCASSPGKDSCQGDSGGPLFFCPSSGACLQLGIVSYGSGCASPRYPGVYADVGALRPWIERVMAVY